MWVHSFESTKNQWNFWFSINLLSADTVRFLFQCLKVAWMSVCSALHFVQLYQSTRNLRDILVTPSELVYIGKWEIIYIGCTPCSTFHACMTSENVLLSYIYLLTFNLPTYSNKYTYPSPHLLTLYIINLIRFPLVWVTTSQTIFLHKTFCPRSLRMIAPNQKTSWIWNLFKFRQQKETETTKVKLPLGGRHVAEDLRNKNPPETKIIFTRFFFIGINEKSLKEKSPQVPPLFCSSLSA